MRDLLSLQSPGRKFFERAKGDAIGFTQGVIDGAGFGHPHLGVVEDQGRDVAGMGITVPNKPTTFGGLIDSSLEDPEVLLGATEGNLGLDLDTSAVVPRCNFEQLGVSDV